MGEGWGEGDKLAGSGIPLPLIPSHQGRGNNNLLSTFPLFKLLV